MTMLGGVPIRVIMPPRMVPKDSGISVSDTARLALRAASMSSDIKQRQRRDIVDDRRQRRTDHRHDADMDRNCPVGPCDEAGDQLHRAGIHQPARDDQHQRDDDDGRMAEAVKRILGRNQPRHHGDKERNESNQIVAEPPPDQEPEQDDENSKKHDLVGRHGWCLSAK
jgi:hypothetical protein